MFISRSFAAHTEQYFATSVYITVVVQYDKGLIIAELTENIDTCFELRQFGCVNGMATALISREEPPLFRRQLANHKTAACCIFMIFNFLPLGLLGLQGRLSQQQLVFLS